MMQITKSLKAYMSQKTRDKSFSQSEAPIRLAFSNSLKRAACNQSPEPCTYGWLP
jgi:hypothetical protein